MDLKITSDSLEAAKAIFRKKQLSIDSSTPDDFDDALDALCVPVEAGWKEISSRQHHHILEFTKEKYSLCWLQHFYPQWRLYKDRNFSKPIATYDAPRSYVAEAQAWANEQIAKMEAAQKKAEGGKCPVCGFKLPCPMCKGLVEAPKGEGVKP